MSGGRFFYKQYHIDEIADQIQSYLDRQGKKIKENWYSKEWLDEHPEDGFHEVYSKDTIEIMKKAVKSLRIAGVYAQRVDWYLSGDDGEEQLVKRTKEELTKYNI